MNSEANKETGPDDGTENTLANTQWSLETPEYLLIIVIGAIAWTVGFVQLINHTSKDAVVFGLYSLPYFVFLVLYSSVFLLWIALLARPGKSAWLVKLITYIQNRAWLALGILAVFGVSGWLILTGDRFRKLPGLQVSLLILILMAGALIIFTGWQTPGRVPVWQKVTGFTVVAIVLIELFVQALAYYGVLPGQYKIDGNYYPYGRVYYNQEGFGNDVTNNWGWYYPNFRLNSSSKKILIVGDTFIRALEISPTQHLGVKLEERIGAGQLEDTETEVLALGHPGLGPSLFLDSELLGLAIDAFEPDEIIVFMELGSDLNNLTKPSSDNVYFAFDKAGQPKVHPDIFVRWHDMAHHVAVGYVGVDLPGMLKSHYLTPHLLTSAFQSTVGEENTAQAAGTTDVSTGEWKMPSFRGFIAELGPKKVAANGEPYTVVETTGLKRLPGQSNFIFRTDGNEEAREAFNVTRQLLDRVDELSQEKGITLRMVTIPVFPDAFFSAQPEAGWEPANEDYDLFLPEKELSTIARANEIPFLAMGNYMLNDNLTTDEVKALYFSDGQGHLTPSGHSYFAEAIYSCFYSATDNGVCVE